ncbi:Necrosis inducing protein NPP1 [Phytophthora megakarya]|uniref:Necrosis inducing protein NPP1 n=1 Tax=Phytophthora megakarya TaxID=4795 RepID=A0A225VGW2_9STRA|nr:Necrosis inducing protein NPP1 [Phytophthora megakarya]
MLSEKAAVKYKPQLYIGIGCASFPAVNAAGDITGGLKGTKGTEGCEKAPLGSQVYGRTAWYQGKWAMMYAWYFPKNFAGGQARKRHNWANIMLWIDNPAVETPKILGASLSQQTLKPPKLLLVIPIRTRYEEPYQKMTHIHPMAFVGTKAIRQNRISRLRWNYTYEGGSNTSTRVSHSYTNIFSWTKTTFVYEDGTYQDLIMWEQLTDAARKALNSANFDEAKVPFNENNFEAALREAWPF